MWNRRTACLITLLTFMVFSLAGCFVFSASIETPDPRRVAAIDWGPPVPLRICAFRDAENGVSEEAVRNLVGSVREEFLLYGLHISLPWIREWKRPGPDPMEILINILSIRIEKPCHMNLIFGGRNAGDVASSLVGFIISMAIPVPIPIITERFGWVLAYAPTHGYAVAVQGFPQFLLGGPTEIVRHEIYHRLGCQTDVEDKHDKDMEDCYKQILRLKELARKAKDDFLPVFMPDGRILDRMNMEIWRIVILHKIKKEFGSATPPN